MSTEIRWGIVGPGRIAENVVHAFAHVPNARPVAVASRSPERADAFASRHGLDRAHGSYAAIIADPDVDVWEAVMWAAVSGTLIALARMFAQRKAATYYQRSKGELPPQLQKGDEVKSTA